MESTNLLVLGRGKLFFRQSLFKSVKSTYIRHLPIVFLTLPRLPTSLGTLLHEWIYYPYRNGKAHVATHLPLPLIYASMTCVELRFISIHVLKHDISLAQRSLNTTRFHSFPVGVRFRIRW